jgi:DNA-binding beta-propeller fold protein YncE
MAILGGGDFTFELSGDDWGELPEGWTYADATAVAVDSSDNVYVFNRGGHPVIVYDSAGRFLRSWGEDIFTNPHGIAVGPDDSIYCVDSADHTVRKFTTEGELLLTLGQKGDPARAMSGDPFRAPTHVAVDPRNSEILVSDGYGNARVHRFSPDGRLMESWGKSGTFPGHFNIVHNIAIDAAGRVYVADRDNRRIQVFDAEGNYQEQWANLSRAACVYVDTRGETLVYVGEYYGGGASNVEGRYLGPRVTVFDTKGNVVARLGEVSYGDEPGRFYAPHGIAVDSKGDIYVAEVSSAEFSVLMPGKKFRSMQKLVKQGKGGG